MKRCKICNKHLETVNHGRKKMYCGIKCRNVTYRAYRKEWLRSKNHEESLNPKGKEQCKICKFWFKNLGGHLRVHKILIKDYRKKYGKGKIGKGGIVNWIKSLFK